jgi:hypothetical protein
MRNFGKRNLTGGGKIRAMIAAPQGGRCGHHCNSAIADALGSLAEEKRGLPLFAAQQQAGRRKSFIRRLYLVARWC